MHQTQLHHLSLPNAPGDGQDDAPTLLALCSILKSVSVYKSFVQVVNGVRGVDGFNSTGQSQLSCTSVNLEMVDLLARMWTDWSELFPRSVPPLLPPLVSKELSSSESLSASHINWLHRLEILGILSPSLPRCSCCLCPVSPPTLSPWWRLSWCRLENGSRSCFICSIHSLWLPGLEEGGMEVRLNMDCEWRP